ncbi:MAG: rRNA adenine N-6-methyltransferase family protein [Segetibacter sp.]
MKLYNRIKNKLNRYWNKPVEIPSYEVKRSALNDYKEKYGLDVLVETGTFTGDTVEYFKNTFKKVVSIELAEDLAKRAQKRFKNDANVKIIKGDSGEALKELVEEINEPILFWLDGHYSSEFFVGDEYIATAKSALNTPVEEELKTILSSRRDHVILIDDARLFNGTNDYPTINKVKKMVKKAGNSYSVIVNNDIIHITPA